MLTITVSGWCLLVAAGLLIGVAKTGFPGAGILAIPMAVIACNGQAKASAGVVLPMLIVGDVLATLYYRRQAETKYVAKLVPCAVLGILIGNYCMGIVTDAELKQLNAAGVRGVTGGLRRADRLFMRRGLVRHGRGDSDHRRGAALTRYSAAVDF